MDGTNEFPKNIPGSDYLQLTPGELLQGGGIEIWISFLSLFSVLFLDRMMPYVFLLSVFLKNFAMCCLISNIFKVKRKCSDIKKFL